MRKAGILTFTYGDNFGQRLQNLAVQEVLKSFGFDVYTIPQAEPRRYKAENRVRHSFFQSFDEQFINYYSEKIGSYKIPKGLKAFDYFVVGSDQVWSPYSTDVNWSFFLKFAPSEKRVAYAPSMAADAVPRRKKALYRWYLHGFQTISVREDKALELIKEFTGVPAQTLIDPTLMFDMEFWNQYLKAPPYCVPSRYVLYYGLGQAKEEEAIHAFAEKMNCEIVSLRKGTEWFNIGPCEFLCLVSRAQYVITDSYHGTIFSILYHRPVYYFHRTAGGINMQSRFDTLFTKLGITIESKGGTMMKCNVNYLIAKEKLIYERSRAVNYLGECFNRNKTK